MVSQRYAGNNLLNYMKQTSIKHEITMDLCRDRHDPNYLKWVGQLVFQDRTFRGVGRSQRICVKNMFEPANEVIMNFIRGRN